MRDLKKSDRKSISIRNSIVMIFVISVLISVAFIGSIVFTNWMSSAKGATRAMSEDMNREISHEINILLEEPYHINEMNQKLIQKGILDLTDESNRNKFFINVLQTHDDEIYGFSYVTATGEYYGVRRNENHTIEIIKNNKDTKGQTWYYNVEGDSRTNEPKIESDISSDPRTLDWYKLAIQAQKPVFSKIEKHFTRDEMTLSAAWPIYDSNGDLKGVLGTHILLTELNKYLSSYVRGKQGYAFVIEKKAGEMIANSFGMKDFTVKEDGKLKRATLSDLNRASIQQAYDEYKRNQAKNFLFEYENESYYTNIEEYSKEGLEWILVSAIPNSWLIDDINRTINLTIMIIAITMILSVMLYYYIVNRLFRPIDNLIDASEQFSMGDLSKRVLVKRNDEISRISISFNKMADKMHQFVDNLETKVNERTGELERTNEILNKTKENLYLILDSTAEGIFGMDLDGKFTFCNQSCIKLLGYQNQEELLGNSVHEQIHHSYRSGEPMLLEECKSLQSLLLGEKTYANDEVFWRADGTNFDVEYHSYPQFKDGKIIGAVITFSNITQKRKDEEKIRYLSCHDTITGLMNRRCFEDALIKYDTNRNLPISIIFADLNGLKLMNDIFGHTSGDMLIKKCAETLKKSCRSVDVLARVGGDEFIVLLPNTESKDAEKIVERVKEQLSNQKVNAVKCSMALGFDTKTEPYQEIEKVMGNAESEMYKEKLRFKKRFGADTIDTIIKTLQEKNPREKTHSESVAALCENMGKEIGLPETETKKLRDVGYLHDIGKIVLDEELLNKEEHLSEDERQKRQQHPVVSYRILNLVDDTLDLADGAYGHHEKWDGSGYPKGLKGEEIPLMSRIIAIAESYEKRISILESLEPESIKSILNDIRKESGTHFDPGLIDIFINMIEGKINKKVD